MKFILFLMMLSTSAHAKPSHYDQAYNELKNLISNPGAEENTIDWIVYQATLQAYSVDSSALAVGKSTFVLDPTATDGYAQSDMAYVQAGLWGETCLASIRYKTGGSEYNLKVLNGAGSVLGTTALTGGSTFADGIVTFNCPSDSSVAVRVQSNETKSNPSPIWFDSVFAGRNDEVAEQNQLDVRVYATHSSSIGPSSSPITLIYNNEIIDTQSAYNTSTGVFTVPQSGIYIIRASGGLTADVTAVGDSLSIRIDVGGSDTILNTFRAQTTTSLTKFVAGTTVRYLTAGQLVNIELAFSISGGSQTTDTGTQHFLEIARVSN